MTQEDKELLFIDLCNRIHYKTICTSKRFDKSILVGMDDDGATFSHVDCLGQTVYELLDIIEFDVKPYLRPMSSMTEEELHEVQEILGKGVEIREGFILSIDSSNSFSYLELTAVFDWLNSHHFDYRGLIPMGLAIEVTDENN